MKTSHCCGFDHIYWRNPSWKTLFLCSDRIKGDLKGTRPLWTTIEYFETLGKNKLLSSRNILLTLSESECCFLWSRKR